MKTQTAYQNAKNELKAVSIEAKNIFKNDFPAIRQIINDNTHIIALNNNLSENKTDLLHYYACKLHPKQK